MKNEIWLDVITMKPQLLKIVLQGLVALTSKKAKGAVEWVQKYTCSSVLIKQRREKELLLLPISEPENLNDAPIYLCNHFNVSLSENR